MAQPLNKFAIVEVRKPKVGENKPAAVTADITIDTRHMRADVKAEWDELKQVRPPDSTWVEGQQPSCGWASCRARACQRAEDQPA